MTTSDYRKVLSQIGSKPVKVIRFNKYNVPKERSCSVLNRKCRRCGRNGGHIQKYGLNLCRQCFREIATRIGFKKYS